MRSSVKNIPWVYLHNSTDALTSRDLQLAWDITSVIKLVSHALLLNFIEIKICVLCTQQEPKAKLKFYNFKLRVFH